MGPHQGDAVDVWVIGQGRVPVTRRQDVSLRGMSAAAVDAALEDAGRPQVTALFVGNMLAGMLSHQQHLGALVADAASLGPVEAVTAEAACGSGAQAARLGWMSLLAGAHDTVVVAGVEHMTHASGQATTDALATASDRDTEGSVGETFVSLNGRLMSAYMERWGVPHEAFAPLSLLAHDNATRNPYAVFHDKRVTRQDYDEARVIVPPVTLYDASPTCDGAAALVLTSRRELVPDDRPPVRIVASASAVDRLAVAARPDPLALEAVARSTRDALERAGLRHADIDVFEVHDAYTSMAAIALEAAGFAAPGSATAMAADGAFSRDGTLPIATMGGLKGRGHPVGATGVYQLAEATLQLTARAGAAQIDGVRRVMTQGIGGTGATVVTHILEAMP